MSTPDGLPLVTPTTRAEWMAWLTENGATEDGCWVRLAKKGSGVPTLTWAEVVEVSLCHGWIDGRRVSEDEVYFRQRITPRRRGSRWSRINRDKAEALIASGEMTPAGRREVEAAKADGRWDAAYEGSASASVPPDLQAALDADPKAAAFFETLSRSNRFAIIFRVSDAKRAETRARRIEKYVAMCHDGQTLY